MRSRAELAAILAMATASMPEGLQFALTDDPDRFNNYPVDTPAEAERVTRELTDLDLERISKAEIKRARKREKYRA